MIMSGDNAQLREAALIGPTVSNLFEVLVNAVHDRCFGVASLRDPDHALKEISDGGGIHEAVHELVRALPARTTPTSDTGLHSEMVAFVRAVASGDRNVGDRTYREAVELATKLSAPPVDADARRALDYFEAALEGATDDQQFTTSCGNIRMLLAALRGRQLSQPEEDNG